MERIERLNGYDCIAEFIGQTAPVKFFLVYEVTSIRSIGWRSIHMSPQYFWVIQTMARSLAAGDGLSIGGANATPDLNFRSSR
jgi:hypothetical protein